MKIKTRVKLNAIPIFWRVSRARRIAKKITKLNDDKRYSPQWRNDFILKKARQFLKMLRVEVKVVNHEKIASLPIGIITPNHQSLFDPGLIVMALAKQADNPDAVNQRSVFLAKKELFSNKYSKGFATILNAFYIDRDNVRESVKVTEQLVEHAKEHRKFVVIFPEGTRTTDGKIGEFKGGAFSIAKKSFLPIIPVTINNSFAITDLGRTNTLKVEIIFHDPIKPISIMSIDSVSIAARVRKIVEKAWVSPQLVDVKADTKYAG